MTQPLKPVDVSRLPCPCGPEGGTHEITATRPKGRGDSVWACIWCNVSWADLDAAMRVEIAPPEDTI